MPYSNKERRRENSRRHYKVHAKEIYRKSWEFRNRVWKKVQDLKMSLHCSRCGTTGRDHPEILDFDHRETEKKSFNIAQSRSANYSFERVLMEIAKCDVLCSNCHRIVTLERVRKNGAPIHKWLAKKRGG